MNKTKYIVLTALSLFTGGILFSYVSAYGDTITLDQGAGCEIQEEAVEIEPDCTDPFFQDMEHRAADTETYEVVPAPTYETYPESGDPEFPLQVIFDQPIDVDVPQESAKVEAYNKAIQDQREAAVVKSAPTPTIVPIVEEVNIPAEAEETEDEIVEIGEQKKVLLEKTISDNEEIKAILDVVQEHEVAIGAPQTLSVAYVFDNHLWEILFVCGIMFLLFSLLFI